MFALIASIFRLLFTDFRFSLSRTEVLLVNETKVKYSDIIGIDEATNITIDVDQFRHVIRNDRWYIRNIVRYQYKVLLVKRVNGIIVDEWEDYYPDFAGKCLDPHYPLVCVANAHIGRYFKKL